MQAPVLGRASREGLSVTRGDPRLGPPASERGPRSPSARFLPTAAPGGRSGERGGDRAPPGLASPAPRPGGVLPNLGARPGPLLPSRLGPRPGGGRRWRDHSASRRDLPAPGHRPPPPAGLRELCRGHFASQCRVAERLPSEFLCFWPCFPRFQQLQALPWTGICLLRVFDI